MKPSRKTNMGPAKKVTTLKAMKERRFGREDGSHQQAIQSNNVILHLHRFNSNSVQRLASSRRSCGSSGGVFTSMGSHSQAGEESNFVVGGGGGSDPSVSNIQEEASTDKLGGEESDITSTQIVVTSTAAEVEVSCSIVFFILIFFSFSVGRNAHMYIDLLNRSIFFLTFYCTILLPVTVQHCRCIGWRCGD